ncbi:MAG TPA: ATP-binding protein [Steroidobacteraceae bacterium]|nr:ATP-binding protein [Steroidobacteraceae bacterium]
MGRLFWKFFAFIWLAQLAGIVAIGSTFWLTSPRFDPAFGDMDSRPVAGDRVAAAAAILHYAGVTAFRDWVDSEAGPAVFAVDDSDHDVLDRRIAPELLAHARDLDWDPRGAALVREVSAPDNRRFRVFSGPRPSPGFGSQSPPPLERAGGPRRALRGRPPLAPVTATLLASLATALTLAWYVAKPIRSLRSAFDAVAGGDLEVRVAPLIGARKDELADLGQDFDRMADRLQASMNGQRRLLHDVSHEMRSPLARLQAAAGLIRLKYGGEESTIERIEEEITRIDRLVGDLLKLSRLEAGELGGPEEEVDLQELVREVVTDANFEAQATDRAVTWDEQTAAFVWGRPEMLHGAIENVVRNALKHASGSSEVRIETSMDATQSRYTLRVLDRGPGVPEDELAGLFNPFFRAANAAETEGYGLGLAIARRSIEAHRGTIGASNRPDGGLVVTITLPVRATGLQAAEGQFMT